LENLFASKYCNTQKVGDKRTSVADPHHFDADPDPAFHFDADPDADPDPDPTVN